MPFDKKGILRVAAIAAIVILPILGIYYLSNARWVHKPLDYVGQNVKNPDGTVEHHQVGDIQLIDQNGKKVTMSDFDSSIIVANIFFATCPEVCPEMNKQVQTIAEKFYKNSKVRFLSVSIDPENDSLPVIKAYADRFRADKVNWQFCTGSKKEIYDWAINDLLLATEQKGQDFIHDDKVVIIDKEKHIRAVLPTRGNSNRARLEALKRIEEDINNLLYEYRQKELDKR
jgi:protein SCO1/2